MLSMCSILKSRESELWYDNYVAVLEIIRIT